MKLKMIVYWTATTLIALETFAGGIVDLTHGRTAVFSGTPVTNVVISLGYPAYVLAILGVWKIPGAITLVVPGLLRLKEWAYAGIIFELSAAAVSHAIVGHVDPSAAAVLQDFFGHRQGARLARISAWHGADVMGAATAKPHFEPSAHAGKKWERDIDHNRKGRVSLCRKSYRPSRAGNPAAAGDSGSVPCRQQLRDEVLPKPLLRS